LVVAKDDRQSGHSLKADQTHFDLGLVRLHRNDRRDAGLEKIVMPKTMPQYYYNVRDGELTLDHEGSPSADIAAARREAVATAGQMLADHQPAWDGTAWEMWVTDKPAGEGKTLLRLVFQATQGEAG
jgi:hypothetical protein